MCSLAAVVTSRWAVLGIDSVVGGRGGCASLHWLPLVRAWIGLNDWPEASSGILWHPVARPTAACRVNEPAAVHTKCTQMLGRCRIWKATGSDSAPNDTVPAVELDVVASVGWHRTLPCAAGGCVITPQSGLSDTAI